MMDYESFRKDYEMKHRASVPVKPRVVRDYPRFVIWGVWVAFLSISVTSGVHTVSTMRNAMEASTVLTNKIKDLIALTSFFGFEVSLFISVFSWQRKSNRWISYAATIVIFIVIVTANLRDVSLSLENDNLLDTAVLIFTGVGIPLVALQSGKTAVDYYRREQVNIVENDAAFLKAQQAWERKIERAYDKHVDMSSVRADADSGRTAGHGYNRTSDAQDKVIAYLRANPDDMQMSVRELADRVGVGKSSVSQARRAILNTNGHGGAG